MKEQPCIFSSGCSGNLRIEQERVHSEALGRSGVKKYVACDQCRQENNTTTVWEAPKEAGTPKNILDGAKKNVGALEFSLRHIPDQWKSLVGEGLYDEAQEVIGRLHDRLSGNIIK